MRITGIVPVTADSQPTQENHWYPAIDPFQSGMLDTGEGHQIYHEQCGNPNGQPVVVLHGGPASGCSPLQRRFFDPQAFRIVLFDQRGCGRSTPRGGLADNDTAALIRDIEQLRRLLQIERWIVFGGSWGASLAIAYAAAHGGACQGLILRGIFLTGKRDLDWFFGGAGTLLPAAWCRLVEHLGLDVGIDDCEDAGQEVRTALTRHLFSESSEVAASAASAWAAWEDAVSRPGQALAAVGRTQGAGPQGTSPAPQQILVDKYRVQAHYLTQECFLGENYLLQQAAQLSPVPVELVHGRLDWVCRPANAWRTHLAIPASSLTWVDQGSHSPYDPPMQLALAAAMRRIQDSIAR